MPHTPRKKSETGFYHVVAKGDGGQIIFESDADRQRYVAELKRSASDFAINVHAYCLMSNHVHLLLEDKTDNLSSFMKQLCESYAMYYRKVTGRVGHVFQGRFWSEPVNSDEYFLAALRYIHANPEVAGMCQTPDYPWSSYKSYLGDPGFVCTKLALELLGSTDAFKNLHNDAGNFALPFPKSTLTRHLSYDELQRTATNLIGRDMLNSLKQMKPQNRETYISLLSKSGFTDTQIARLTGIGQASIYRSLRKKS